MKSPIPKCSEIVQTILALSALLSVLSPGSAEAQGVTFALGNYTVPKGGTVTAAVTVTNFDNVGDFQFTLQWDPTVLSYQSVGNFNSSLGVEAGDFGTPGSGEATGGQLTVLWYYNVNPLLTAATVSNGTSLFTVNFAVIGSPGSSSALALVDTPTRREVDSGAAFAPLPFVTVNGQVQVSSHYSVTASVSPAGAGSVSGAGAYTNGAAVVVMADANGGYQFVAWTENGQVVSRSLEYNFTVSGDRSLVANFVAYPFVPPKGSYSGLFSDETNGVSPQSSGCFTLTVAAKSAYSGSLQLAGAKYSFSGQFDGSGRASKTIARRGLNSLAVALNLDLLSGADWVSGTISDGGWTAELYGGRTPYDGRTIIAPEAGSYTMVIAGGYGSGNEPAGDSYGTITVSKAGLISLRGTLADGTKLTPTASLSMYGQWPLCVSLDSGQGILWGWFTFTNAAGLGGSVAWTEPVVRSGPYQAGFSLAAAALGARYLPPGRGTNVLGLTVGTNLTLTLTGGGLAEGITNRIALAASDQVTALSGPKLSLSFTPSTGGFSGSVLNPGASKAVSFGGVVLQGERRGAGFFLGNGGSGQVLLEP
jgi:hypothetical protein